MNETVSKIEAELTNACTCQTENDETGKYEPSNECFGDCWRNSVDDYEHVIIKPWLAANKLDEDDTFIIHGFKMTWENTSGSRYAKVDDILNLLKLERGEFRLVFTLDGDRLEATRYSHDNPMGSFFIFEMKRK